LVLLAGQVRLRVGDLCLPSPGESNCQELWIGWVQRRVVGNRRSEVLRVVVDQATETLPVAQMLQQIAPMLRGPAFSQAWPNIENSLGLDRIPEPTRALVLGTHKVEQDVVLGYWDQVLTTDPAEFQAWTDAKTAGIRIPCLAVFGRRATDGERKRFDDMLDVQIEEWVGDGHFVHLVDPQRFATRLRTFVDYCNQAT
jgi:pimeloyl-ACP methyl ester carboxylesterase